MNPTPHPRPWVCFAVPQEAKPFRRAVLQGPDSPQILVTGMGPQNARLGMEAALAHESPSYVLTCGFAGGLKSDWPRGAILFETTSTSLADALHQAGAHSGRFSTQPRVAVTRQEKHSLWTETHADAVEMESGVIQALCAGRSIPCATVRVISDAADEDMPLDFNALMDSSYRLRPSRLAWSLVRQPQRLPALIRLGTSTQRAAQSLAELLTRFFNQSKPSFRSPSQGNAPSAAPPHASAS